MKVTKHAVVLGVTKAGKRLTLGVGEPSKMRTLYKTTDGKKEKDAAVVVHYFDTKGNVEKRTIRKPGQQAHRKTPQNQGDNQNNKPPANNGQGNNPPANNGQGNNPPANNGQGDNNGANGKSQ